jgi:hypothetical protein
MTPNEIEAKMSELEKSVALARAEAQAANAKASDALKYLRNLATGIEAEITGSARDVSNAIDDKYGKG